MKNTKLLLSLTTGLLVILTSVIVIHRPAQAACATMPTDKGTVTVSASAPSAGTYYLWSRNKAPATNNNGYYLQVDGNCGITVGDAVIPVNTWTWVNYQNGSSSNRISMSLTAGTHTFTFYGLDPGVLVDRVLLTTDATCTPTSTGDNCANSASSTPAIVTSLSNGGTSYQANQPVAGTIQIGSTDSNTKTLVKIDGKEVSTGNGLVNVDTSKLSDGYHDITIVTTDANGVTHVTRQRILVKNRPHWWQQPYNWLYRLLGHNKSLAVASIMVIATSLFAGLGVGAYLIWAHRLWQKVPGLNRIKWLDTLHPADRLKTKAHIGELSTGQARSVKLFGHHIPVSPRALFAMIGFALTGGLLVTFSFAATPAAFTVEPERGTLSGITTGSDSNAANGSFIQFGDGTGGTTTPPTSSCPAGQTGTPPNCVTPPSTSTCPSGQTGTPPNCITPPVSGGTCPAYPAVPTVSCVGPPSGYSLATASSFTSSANGQTIDGKLITGNLTINHNNVTVTNSRIKGYVFANGHSGLVLKNVDIGPDACPGAGDGATFAVNTDDYTIIQSHLHNIPNDILRVGSGNYIVQDSLLDKTCYYAGDHLDGIQFYDPGGVGHISVVHSVIDVRPVNNSNLGNSAIFWADNPGSGTTLTMYNNKFLGGGYTTALYDAKAGSGVVLNVHDNIYAKNTYLYGPCASNVSIPYNGNSGLIFTNNVFDTGGAVSC